MTDTYIPVLTDEQISNLTADWYCFFRDTPGSAKRCIQEIERAAIEAYQRQQWQHISTAPKDGTEILLADDDGQEARMRWDAFMRNGLCGDAKGFWTCPGRNFTWDHRGGFGPTKWKRLPPAPGGS
jgi:hypothetical protein